MDRRLANDNDAVESLVATARGSTILSQRPIDILSALRMNDARIRQIAGQLADQTIALLDVVPISYGRGLDGLADTTIKILIDALVEHGGNDGTWAAVEIMTLVTHGRTEVDAGMAQVCKTAVLAPSLADGPTRNLSHFEYGYDRQIKLLGASQAIDGAFAREYGQLIERACRSVGGYANRPSKALRAGLSIVAAHAAAEIWPVLAGFWEVATRIERDRLSMIVAASDRFAYNNPDRTMGGALFAVPSDAIIDWVEVDPAGRMAFPITILQRTDEAWAWHPALLDLAERYEDLKAFRAALRARILPGSFSGTLRDHLHKVEAPLAAWSGHATFSGWAATLANAIAPHFDEQDAAF